MTKLTRQISAFTLIGLAATATHVVVGLGLHHLAGLSPLTANLGAFAAATLITIFSNSAITFRGHDTGRAGLVKALATILVGLILNQSIVYVATEWARLSYEIALALVLCVVPVATFVLFKFWAFRGR